MQLVTKDFVKKINYLKLRNWVSPIGVISSLNKMVFDSIVEKIDNDEPLLDADIEFINDIYEIY